MKTITLSTLAQYKTNGEKFAVITAYDASFAKIAGDAGIEVILVGDSLGNVIQGHDSTVPVTIHDMAYHTANVKRANPRSLIISDMPFMAYHSLEQAMTNAAVLMQAGAHVVKLEGGSWLTNTFTCLAQRGVPTCAHLGLTPQSVNKLGGYKVQGRAPDQAHQILEDAKALEAAGADLLVLECVPANLAAEITEALSIPVIGIGAGADTDAQVLVIYDLLGISSKAPKFSKNYLIDTGDVQAALTQYSNEVKSGQFPGPEHSFK